MSKDCCIRPTTRATKTVRSLVKTKQANRNTPVCADAAAVGIGRQRTAKNSLLSACRAANHNYDNESSARVTAGWIAWKRRPRASWPGPDMAHCDRDLGRAFTPCCSGCLDIQVAEKARAAVPDLRRTSPASARVASKSALCYTVP